MVPGSPFQHNRQQACDGSTDGAAYSLLCSLLMGIAPGTKKTLTVDDVIGQVMSHSISRHINAGDKATGSCTSAANHTTRRN